MTALFVFPEMPVRKLVWVAVAAGACAAAAAVALSRARGGEATQAAWPYESCRWVEHLLDDHCHPSWGQRHLDSDPRCLSQ
jgi:hypothetical protein